MDKAVTKSKRRNEKNTSRKVKPIMKDRRKARKMCRSGKKWYKESAPLFSLDKTIWKIPF